MAAVPMGAISVGRIQIWRVAFASSGRSLVLLYGAMWDIGKGWLYNRASVDR